MKSSIRSLIFIVFTIALMQGKTVSSGASGEWKLTGTWQGGNIPTASDTVIISSGHTVTIDSNYIVAMITVKGNATLQFDGYSADLRRLTSNSDLVVEATGKILPSGPFTTGSSNARIDIYGNLIVNGTITYFVQGTTSGTRYLMYLIMTTGGGSTKSVSIQGTGTIGVGYFQINKSLATDTVAIKPGVTIVADFLYLYKGTLNNSLNNISTYFTSRFDNASQLLAKPIYRGNGSGVSYLSNSNITSGVELPDTIQTFITQYSTKVVTLDKNTVISNSVDLNDGRVNTDKFTFKLNGSVLNTGINNVRGFVMGALEKPIMNASDSLKKYEVGSANGYAEVNLKFSKLKPKGSLVVRTYGDFHKLVKDTTLSLKRFWTFIIKDTVQFGACEVTLRYASGDFANGISESKLENSLIVGQFDNIKQEWTYPVVTKRDTSGPGGTIQVSSLTSLSDLVIVQDPKTLSVEDSKILPVSMELFQNYPNPFNPVTMINYQLPLSKHVTLKVYDVIGREVATLVNEAKEAGSYSVKFDASKIASGIYFYTLKASNITMTKKLLLIK